jgi:hypothetical protein
VEPEASNVSTIIVITLIVVWGFWEYHERDIRHKKAIHDLRNGTEPHYGTQPNWTKVATAAATAVALLVVDVAGISFFRRLLPLREGFLFVFIAELILFSALLLMMALRDAGKLRKG